MKHLYQPILGFFLAFTLALGPTLPLWSQTPSSISSPPPTVIGKSGTYASVPCATLTAPLAGFDEAARKSPFPAGAVEGEEYECGYLTVPERHSQPDGKTIQVGIAIIKSPNPNPPEPLLLFQGGPGGSSIGIFPLSFLPRNELSLKLLSERDVIIFEKRGNRYSKPYLNCPEYKEDNVYLDTATTAKTLEGLQVCRDRLVQAGVNLAAFNSVESAHDVAALAKALGYDQVNLYGVSYGTELAQDVLRLHPDIVRSVVLDGVVPNEPSIDSQYAIILDRLITQIDAACADDADCHAQYPDVKGTFEATYERLNQTPGTVQVPTAKGIEQQPVTGLNLAMTIFSMAYMSGAPFVVPALVYQVSDGDYSMIVSARSLGGGGGIATGTYYSVKCAEDVAYIGELSTNGVAPFAKEWGGFMQDFMVDACQVWNVPAVDPSMRQAVASDTPALILSGQFDPITPPPFADKVAQGFSNGTSVVFPANGHGAISGRTQLCTFDLMAAFLNDPSQPPDVSCAGEGTIEFVTKKNTLMAPGTVWLSESIINLRLVPLIQRVLLLVLLMLFPLVWLVLWLLGRRRQPKPTTPTPLAARLAPWLGVLLALLSAGWIGLQAIGLEMTTVSGTPGFFLGIYRLFVGIDRSYAWIYVIPLLIALASIGMVWLAVMAWRNKYWGKARRIYYAFTAGVAIAYTLFLAAAGQLTVFL